MLFLYFVYMYSTVQSITIILVIKTMQNAVVQSQAVKKVMWQYYIKKLWHSEQLSFNS